MLLGYIGRHMCYNLFNAPDSGSTASGGETTAGTSQTGGEPGKSTASDAASGSGDPPSSSGETSKDRTFTQAEIDAIVKQRLAEQKARDKKQADEAKLAQDNEWKTLAEQRQQEILDLNAKVAKQEQDALRSRIGAKHKLPEKLIDRIRGETEADMEADAKDLAKTVKAPDAPETDAGKGSQPPAAETDARGSGTAQPRKAPFVFQQANDVSWG